MLASIWGDTNVPRDRAISATDEDSRASRDEPESGSAVVQVARPKTDYRYTDEEGMDAK